MLKNEEQSSFVVNSDGSFLFRINDRSARVRSRVEKRWRKNPAFLWQVTVNTWYVLVGKLSQWPRTFAQRPRLGADRLLHHYRSHKARAHTLNPMARTVFIYLKGCKYTKVEDGIASTYVIFLNDFWLNGKRWPVVDSTWLNFVEFYDDLLEISSCNSGSHNISDAFAWQLSCELCPPGIRRISIRMCNIHLRLLYCHKTCEIQMHITVLITVGNELDRMRSQ